MRGLITLDLRLVVQAAADVNPEDDQPLFLRRLLKGRQFVFGDEIRAEEIGADEQDRRFGRR